MVDLSGYKLTFSDEFNERSISQTGETTTWASMRSEWRFDAHSEIGFGRSSFVDASSGYDPFRVADGVLTITAVPDRTAYGYPGSWESGLITTQGSFSQKYGYFEMRADLADSAIGWDAFWLLPDEQYNPNNLPGWQELDIIEHYGNNNIGTYSWIHTTDPHERPQDTLQVYGEFANQTSGFHTYGMMWTEQTITFYYDGVEIGSKPTPSDMHSKMYLLANLAVQTEAPATGDPFSMKIDYIRVYAADTGSAPQAANTAPTLNEALLDQTVRAGNMLAYNVPANAFSDKDYGDVLSYRATLADGSSLPAWLSFDSRSGAFSGTPAAESAGAYAIKIVALDSSGASASDEFVLTVEPSLNFLYGSAAAETLSGAAGSDVIDGKAGADKLNGGAGDDVLIGGAAGDRLDGGAGSDTASYETASSRVTVDLARPSANTGDAARDTYVSIENLLGSRFDDILSGDAFANVITGGAGSDRLYGRDGRDTLVGGDGADFLYGGAQADYLSGGAGADVFVFQTLSDSRPGDFDTIYDFARGVDRIDLRSIDANTKLRADQSFSFIGANGFTGKAGELNFVDGLVSGDVNGDRVADFQVRIENVTSLSASDFYL